MGCLWDRLVFEPIRMTQSNTSYCCWLIYLFAIIDKKRWISYEYYWKGTTRDGTTLRTSSFVETRVVRKALQIAHTETRTKPGIVTISNVWCKLFETKWRFACMAGFKIRHFEQKLKTQGKNSISQGQKSRIRQNFNIFLLYMSKNYFKGSF